MWYPDLPFTKYALPNYIATDVNVLTQEMKGLHHLFSFHPPMVIENSEACYKSKNIHTIQYPMKLQIVFPCPYVSTVWQNRSLMFSYLYLGFMPQFKVLSLDFLIFGDRKMSNQISISSPGMYPSGGYFKYILVE